MVVVYSYDGVVRGLVGWGWVVLVGIGGMGWVSGWWCIAIMVGIGGWWAVVLGRQ